MRKSILQRFARLLCACVYLFVISVLTCASAEGRGWTRVRSENFVVVSNAGEGAARQAAVRLEELRATFARLGAQDEFDVSIPVTVIFFQNAGDYEFFKPMYRGDLRRDVAGYFQFSPDVNYITLSQNVGGGRDPLSVLSHEYVHALVRNNYAGAPIWFNEGLAQYYSEFELSADRRRVRLGRELTHRLDALGRERLLPLKTLLSADVYSAHYQQHDRHELFYAQSWAFVHYLLSDASGARQAQLARYLELAGNGTPVEESFREAFKVDFGQMEGALAAYVRAARYGVRSELFNAPVPAGVPAESSPLSEAETQAALGDLLLHTNRTEDAEEYLARALKLDANLGAAHASLGLLRLQQNRLGEAREHLERAVSLAPENYLAHFYYADLLLREGLETEKTVTGYAATTRLIRAELKRAIELAPNFLEAYALLGRVDLERSPRVEETFALLGHAASVAPRRSEFKLLLAQLHARRAEFDRARRILELLARDRRSAQTRAQARTLLEKLATSEELAAAQRRAQLIAPAAAANTLTPAAANTVTAGEGDVRGAAGGSAATSSAAGGGTATLNAAGGSGASPGKEDAARVSTGNGANGGASAGAASATPGTPPREGEAAITATEEEAQPCDMPQPGPQFKPLRFEGRQVCGQLVSVECEDAAGVTLLVETPQGILKLRSPALNRIRFVSYTTDVRGRIECGLRTRSNPVLVTYRPPPDARLADGEVIAVEFVPPDWVH
ncbi:MAG TPA: tetratricopeptide repeat protein [Pyrinomonadaceae bacterium]|nr:tetratricopeptide repeat protein [Pyrinomonadaceae bacterium]